MDMGRLAKLLLCAVVMLGIGIFGSADSAGQDAKVKTAMKALRIAPPSRCRTRRWSSNTNSGSVRKYG